jgi:hypothetical protein
MRRSNGLVPLRRRKPRGWTHKEPGSTLDGASLLCGKLRYTRGRRGMPFLPAQSPAWVSPVVVMCSRMKALYVSLYFLILSDSNQTNSAMFDSSQYNEDVRMCRLRIRECLLLLQGATRRFFTRFSNPRAFPLRVAFLAHRHVCRMSSAPFLFYFHKHKRCSLSSRRLNLSNILLFKVFFSVWCRSAALDIVVS